MRPPTSDRASVGRPTSLAGADVRALFVRQRTGLRTSHHAVRRHGAGDALFFRSILPRLPTRPFSLASPQASVAYSRSSDLGSMPHQDISVSMLRPLSDWPVHPVQPPPFRAAAKCGRPTGFGGPPLLPGFSEPITTPPGVNPKGGPASGLVRDRFNVSRDSFNHALASGDLRPRPINLPTRT